MTTEDLTIEGPRPLDATVHLPDRADPGPAVVIAHGFKGFMDWGFFPALGDLLAERGLTAVRFTFSGAGVGRGEDRVTDLEAFRRDTISNAVEDLEAVLSTVAGGRIGSAEVDGDRLGLVGHSRGGGVSILVADRPPWRERLGVLVTWASIATFARFGDEEVAAWRRDGVLPVENARTGQELALGLDLLEDYEAHRERFDVEAAASRLRVPWLIVHGTEDESVPVEEGRRLHRAASSGEGRVELLEVEGGSHTFGATHPFHGPTPALIQAMNATQEWICRHLRKG